MEVVQHVHLKILKMNMVPYHFARTNQCKCDLCFLCVCLIATYVILIVIAF